MSRVLFLSLALILFAGVSGLVRRAKTSSRTPAKYAATLPAGAPQGAPGTPALLRVFVHPSDIYPNEIRVSNGSLRLRAENETLGDVSLALDLVPSGQSSQRVAVVQTLNHGSRADQVLSLPKGTYLYYDESRPDITGTLIVEGQ